MHFLVWWMMGIHSSFCLISIVKNSLCNWFEGSLCGKLCSAMLITSGLISKLGRNVLRMYVGIIGSCVISA